MGFPGITFSYFTNITLCVCLRGVKIDGDRKHQGVFPSVWNRALSSSLAELNLYEGTALNAKSSALPLQMNMLDIQLVLNKELLSRTVTGIGHKGHM